MKFIDKDLKLEEERREIQRKHYEEFVYEMESILNIGLWSIRSPESKDENEKIIHQKLNQLTWKMFISAPDNVITAINKSFQGEFNASKRKNIYLTLRKNLLWNTKIKEEDLLWWSKTGNYE